MKVYTSKPSLIEIRKEFPVLHQQINNNPLVYFDNAATTQKPKSVISAIVNYYENYNANIHRGVHTLAEKATIAFELTRKTIGEFLNSRETEEIIFTRGTTEAINLVATSLGNGIIKSGDEIIVSTLEHHSNFVPWQQLAEKTGAILKIIPIHEDGSLNMEAYFSLLSEKTKLVAVNHVSNALGTINPIKKIIEAAKNQGALILIDGAQASSHIEIDVQELNCDFYAISAHKMYGPTGIGALYGKREILESMPPYQFGGEMIRNVSFEKTTFNDIPYKFEAGTPHIEGVIAWKSALDFVSKIGKKEIMEHEHELTEYAIGQWQDLKGIKMFGPKENRVSVVSFVFENIHSFDIGQMLDARGIAVRTGHHCTEPLMSVLGVDGTVRASFAVYNTREEIDTMTKGLERIINFFK
ncbi:MAG: cysteine desulfurase [Cyclobacteriaceae bacterium]|nr:cysteine desulfurase [Cyclobacteriaceae bacterium]